MREWGIKNGRRVSSILKGFFLCGLLGMSIFAENPTLGQPPENWAAGIAYDVTQQAQITKVSWYMGKTEAGQMLFYEIGIRNLGEKPKRFKLTIYPLEGDPVSGFYPLVKRKGKPLALEPKEEMVLKWPVFAKEMPKGFALVVKEVKE